MSDEPNNIRKFLTALVGPVQSLEEALQQLLSERSIDTAIGEQLDQIGRIVNQERAGLDDETYRNYLRARISVNSSDGTVEDLIKVIDLVVYSDAGVYTLETQSVATVVVRVDGVVITSAGTQNVLLEFLKDAVSAGIRIILILLTDTEAETFAWGGAGVGKGWGDSLNVDTGGKFAHALE